MDRKITAERLENLVLFESLRSDPLIRALKELLACDRETGFSRGCALARALYPSGSDLTEAVLRLVLRSDNLYIRAKAAGRETDPEVGAWMVKELEALSEAASWDSETVEWELGLPGGSLPGWRAERRDFTEAYARQLSRLHLDGYGIFAYWHVFTATPEGELVPVRNPDPQRLGELCGYEAEREKVLRNTQALLAGGPANNVLLYGDAGTGKSSCVKAIANEYAPLGLRLVQLDKSDLRAIPQLLEKLAESPLKFILFIDDLSFAENDRDFTALKTLLEGSVTARAKNTVVYATSNRRHLVSETFRAREGDQIHLNDTLEEISSLSARFGLTVTFLKPDKALFSEIVCALAEQYGLEGDREALLRGAEAYAIRAGGRSPRLARQYIEYKMTERAENL